MKLTALTATIVTASVFSIPTAHAGAVWGLNGAYGENAGSFPFASTGSSDLGRLPALAATFNPGESIHSVNSEFTGVTSVSMALSSTSAPRGSTTTFASATLRADDFVVSAASGAPASGFVRMAAVYSFDFEYVFDSKRAAPGNATMSMQADFLPAGTIPTNGGVLARSFASNGAPSGFTESGSLVVGPYFDLPINQLVTLDLSVVATTSYGNGVLDAGQWGMTTAGFSLDGFVFADSNPLGSDGYVFSSESLGVRNATMFEPVPAPGTLGLLATGGIALARRRRRGATALAVALTAGAASSVASAQNADNTFTYQGYLEDASGPVDGFGPPIEFRIVTTETPGTGVVRETISIPGGTVLFRDGVFSVDVKSMANSAFNNNQQGGRFLEIVVNGDVLEPRIPFTAAPYALNTRGVIVDPPTLDVRVGTELTQTLNSFPGIFTAANEDQNDPKPAFFVSGLTRDIAYKPGTALQIGTYDQPNDIWIERMTLDPSGRMGLGGSTTSDARLSVFDSAGDSAALALIGPDAGQNPDLEFLGAEGGRMELSLDVGNADALDLKAGDGRLLWTVTQDGLIGMGTDMPEEKLHLTSLGGVVMILDADTNNGGSERQNARISFRQDGGATTARIGFRDPGSDTGSSNTFEIVNEENQDVILGTAGRDLVTLNRDGDVIFDASVGINDTNPSGSLSVIGSMTVNSGGIGVNDPADGLNRELTIIDDGQGTNVTALIRKDDPGGSTLQVEATNGATAGVFLGDFNAIQGINTGAGSAIVGLQSGGVDAAAGEFIGQFGAEGIIVRGDGTHATFGPSDVSPALIDAEIRDGDYAFFRGGMFVTTTATPNDFAESALVVDQRRLIGNNLAEFRTNGTNVIRFDNLGVGYFNGGVQPGGADIAEWFSVEGARDAYTPGDVLVVSLELDRTVAKSTEPYSTRIAGVHATKPGVLLTERDVDADHSDMVPMGVVGVVPTKVTSEGGAIRRGDLLVTSSLAGHAMKGVDRDRMLGAIIGRALENFEGPGEGMIRVMVSPR